MHRLLERQIRRTVGATDGIPESVAALLAAVDEAYRQADEDRLLLERSLDLTSEELLERNEQLRRDNQALAAGKREKEQAVSLLQATLESTADGILVVDRSGKIVSYNRRFAEMWAIPDEILEARDDGRAIEYVCDQLADPESFVAGIEALYGQPEKESYDYLQFKDGKIFERYSRPQRVDERCVGRVWSFRDVTEHRRLEQQLRLSQRLEAVGRLAGGVAHDFNNLLTAILGSSALIHDRLDATDPLRIETAEITRAGARAAELTRQMLAFSRKQVLDRRPLRLNAVVGEMERMMRRLIGEHIELIARPAPDLGIVEADPTQIEQVVTNLVVNARDALPAGGTITIETRNVVVDACYRRRRPGVPEGSYVMLAVSDDGEGIDPELQERIFEPFFTTKEPGQGTGLGLAVVYGIVKQSGGFIWVYSERGLGTTFKVYLPRALAAEVPAAADHAAAAATDLSGSESILLVEDEPLVRRLAARILRGRGYRVLEAPGPAQALEGVLAEPEPIDLLLTDVVMPGMSGHELARRVRRVRPSIRVIYMSGYSESLVQAQGLGSPDDSVFVSKPFSTVALLECVRSALAAATPPPRPAEEPEHARAAELA